MTLLKRPRFLSGNTAKFPIAGDENWSTVLLARRKVNKAKILCKAVEENLFWAPKGAK
jgi:hypothetical protein